MRYPDDDSCQAASSQMAAETNTPQSLEDPRVIQRIKEYREAMERGETLSREELLAEFPYIADEVASCLDALEIVQRIAPKFNQEEASADSPPSARRGPPAAGRLGDYRILRQIGRGGMGVVYEAEQISLRRRVALKVLPFAAVLDPRQLQRFRNEAQAAASLRHEHIVQVYSVGSERAVHFYAMEYIEGQTLAQIISGLRSRFSDTQMHTVDPCRSTASIHLGQDPIGASCFELAGRSLLQTQAGAPISTLFAPQTRNVWQGGSRTGAASLCRDFYRSAVRLGVQAAEALEHAHRMGVVHRDIKPSNLLVDASGKLFISDFGLAQTRTGANLTMTGDVLGTLRYMSPEQAQGQRSILDHRTDIYSLGTTLYELLTLEPAFGSSDRHTLLHQILEGDFRPPREIVPDLPVDLETIVLKAMAVDPAARYESAQALADDLRRFLDDRPIRARRPSSWERAVKWAHRHAAVVMTAAVMVLVLLAGLAASTLWVWAERNEARRQRDLARSQQQLAETRRLQVLDREKILRRHVYAADVHWAWQAYEVGEMAGARRILQQLGPAAGQEDLRDFTWHYLWHSTQNVWTTLDGHQDVIYCAAFSPDGAILATAGRDQTIVLWDVARRQKLRTLQGFGDDVNFLAFSPDGTLLASAGDDSTVRVWDVSKARLLQMLTTFTLPVAWVGFVADGKTLLASEVHWDTHDTKTSAWDPDTGTRLWTVEGWRAFALADDGRIVASTKNGRVLGIIDPGMRKQLASTETLHEKVLAASFSPDGRWVASGSRDACVRIWQTETLRLKAVLRGHQAAVRSVVFSRDGATLVSTGDDGQIRIWHPTEGNLLRVLGAHLGAVWCAAVSPDGKTLATGAGDRSLRLWSDWQTGTVRCLPRQSRPVTGLAFLPDSRTLATAGGESQVRLWDTDTGRQVSSIELPGKQCGCLAVSVSRGLMAIGTHDAAIHFCDLNSPNRSVARIEQPAIQLGAHHEEYGLPAGAPFYLAFSPDASLLACYPMNFPGFPILEPTVWDVPTGGRRLSLDLPGDCEGHQRVAFSPDGTTLAASCQTRVQLWDLGSRRPRTLAPGHLKSVRCVAFSPDGTILATGGRDSVIKFFDAKSLEPRATLLGHHDMVELLAFSPDGKTLASATRSVHASVRYECEVKLWDVFTGRELATLNGQRCRATCLAFSPDGTRLAVAGATADRSGEVVVWLAPRNDRPDNL